MSTMKISTFEFELEKAIPPTKEKDIVISNYTPPVREQKPKGREYIPKEREVFGPYLEEVFYKNEIARYDKKQKEDKQIQYEFLEEFKSSYKLRKRFKDHKETINHLRTLYNRRQLYAAQPSVYLLSLRYNEDGIVTVDGRSWYTYLYFIEAYKRCIAFKIADPRFIEPDKIIALRNRINSDDPNWADWQIPDQEWIDKFERKIDKSAYNSVYFPAQWAREASPSEEEFD